MGSVDAFQGMEFDVIFLSVVRSNDKKPMVRLNRESQPEPINYEYLEKYKGIDKKQIDVKSAEYVEWEVYRDKVGMQNYGFLISENRYGIIFVFFFYVLEVIFEILVMVLVIAVKCILCFLVNF